MDKSVTKRLLASTGIPLPLDSMLRAGQPIPDDLVYPVVAKTPCGGSTIGIYICHDAQALERALTECASFAPEVLVEQYIEGVEITVATIESRALPVVAIRPESGFFDFEAKYTKGKTRYVVPADIPAAPALASQRFSEICARTLGLSGLCRSDFIVDRDGTPWFLEVNTIPGMTETSLSPMAAAEAGIGFDALVEQLLFSARLHLSKA
jgi:D-alanine-D-alanine ligase